MMHYKTHTITRTVDNRFRATYQSMHSIGEFAAVAEAKHALDNHK